jgi:hypothetical protein
LEKKYKQNKIQYLDRTDDDDDDDDEEEEEEESTNYEAPHLAVFILFRPVQTVLGSGRNSNVDILFIFP